MARRSANRAHVLSSPAWLAALCLCALPACGSRDLALTDALELSAPHLEHFRGFDAWARRAATAANAWRDRRALEEAVFAPIRREQPVWAAWVEREGAGTVRLAFGRYDVPPDLPWVHIDTDSGSLGVAKDTLSDPRSPRASAPQPCVLLRRQRRAPDGAAITVTVAYRRPS